MSDVPVGWWLALRADRWRLSPLADVKWVETADMSSRMSGEQRPDMERRIQTQQKWRRKRRWNLSPKMQ